MNHLAYFEIQSSDPAKLAAFYNAVFGWNFVKDELVPMEYYRTPDTNAGMMGAILQRPAETPPHKFGTNAYVCSIQVASFDETSEKILRLGGSVALPKFAVRGRCWQGYFIDPHGNTFGLFQADTAAQ